MTSIHVDGQNGVCAQRLMGAFVDLGFDLTRFNRTLKHGFFKGVSFSSSRIESGRERGVFLSLKISGRPKSRSNMIKPDPDIYLRKMKCPARVKDTIRAVFSALEKAENNQTQAPLRGSRLRRGKFDENFLWVLGIASALDELKINKLRLFAITMGEGIIKTNGKGVVFPRQETLNMLRPFKIRFREAAGELTTPLGAAVLSVCGQTASAGDTLDIVRTGIGLDGREPEAWRNALSVMMIKSAPGEQTPGDIHVLEANIDDMSPVIYERVFEILLAEGALDVYTIPIMMKKARPAQILGLMCERSDINKLAAIIFRETTTIGLRYYPVARIGLKRRDGAVRIAGTEVRYKKSYLNGKRVNVSFDVDGSRRVADKLNIPLKEIMEMLQKKNV